jgi:transglutaminase-like putative cysteine protease
MITINETLKETKFANFNSLELQSALKSLVVEKNSNKTAINIYNFVRDEIMVGASRIEIASATLNAKKRFSQMKGNLAIALFRGAGIPARYRLFDFDEKKILGLVDKITYIAFPSIRPFMPNGKIIHVIPQVYLNEEWLNVDPLFDIGFFNGMK